MTFRLLSLILISVSISAIAQITLKTGMSGKNIQAAIDNGEKFRDLALTIAAAPLVWLELTLYFFGALVWLLVLAKLDVSLAYPFVGLGFIFTMLLGFFLLGETVSLARVGGTLLVVLGVVLISRY